MQSGTVDGLYYEVHGGPAADRATVILSAGLGGSGAFWAPQMEALLSRFRVVLYDHRGTGRSVRTLPDRPYAVSAMGDDIVKVMDALGLERAHVVGHAAGGNAGLAMALDHADRIDRLVVVNGWSRPDPHIKRCFDTRLALLNNTGIAAYVHAQPLFLYPADWLSANHARLEAEEVHHIHGFPDPDVMRARIQALLDFDIDDALPSHHVPGAGQRQRRRHAGAPGVLAPPGRTPARRRARHRALGRPRLHRDGARGLQRNGRELPERGHDVTANQHCHPGQGPQGCRSGTAGSACAHAPVPGLRFATPGMTAALKIREGN